MIAINTELAPDPYLDSIAHRSAARPGMSPEEIAATVSPQDPKNVVILPHREEGYGLRELAALGNANIVLLPSEDRGQGLIVIDGGKLGFLSEEAARITGNLAPTERVTPEISIRAAGLSESYAQPYVVSGDGTFQGSGSGIVFNQGALLESNMTVAVHLAHHTARLADYRNIDAGDRVLLDGLQDRMSSWETAESREAVLRQRTEDTHEADHRMASLTRHEPRLQEHFVQLLRDEQVHGLYGRRGLALPEGVDRHAALHHQTGIYSTGETIDMRVEEASRAQLGGQPAHDHPFEPDARALAQPPIDDELHQEWVARSAQLASEAQQRSGQEQAQWEIENARVQQERARIEQETETWRQEHAEWERQTKPQEAPERTAELRLGIATVEPEQKVGSIDAEGIVSHPLNDTVSVVGRGQASVYGGNGGRSFDMSGDVSAEITLSREKDRSLAVSPGLGIGLANYRDTTDDNPVLGVEGASLAGVYARVGLVADLGRVLVEADVRVPVASETSREIGVAVGVDDVFGRVGVGAFYRDIAAPDSNITPPSGSDYPGSKKAGIGIRIPLGGGRR